MRLFAAYVFFAICTIVTNPLHAASLTLSDKLVPGSAVLLKVDGVPPGARLRGDLNKRSFPITKDGLAIIALDMETKDGNATVRVRITHENGKKETISRKVWVGKRQYKEEHISLPKKKVDLGKQDLSRARKETASIKETYKLRKGKVGYLGGFRQAVTGRFSGVFGSRRVLNGKPRRPHNGVDIAAPKGTPIVTTAPGTVVLTGNDYFFTGNTVVVHHGHGVTSLYSHLDAIMVEEGEWVPADTVIGTIGMTGRATGPHLHWGMMVRGARVDPMLMPGIRKTTNQ